MGAGTVACYLLLATCYLLLATCYLLLAEERRSPRRNSKLKQAKQVAAARTETRFNELVQYQTKHGDCDISTKKGKLGPWASKQRVAYRANSLEQSRIDRLDSIGFKWALKEQVPWETRFNDLVQYKATHGNCGIPFRQGKLGSWAHIQRNYYKNNKLSQDRIDRLNDIDFDWTPPTGRSRKRREKSSSHYTGAVLVKTDEGAIAQHC